MNTRRLPHISLNICLLLAPLLLTNPLSAQYTKEYAPFPVVENSQPLELPFLGGLFSPKPTLIDFDNDGLVDLMINEISGKLIYLHNIGNASQAQWEVLSERLGGLNVGLWHAFCDIDGDDDFDLFCEGVGEEVRFFRNESVGSNIIYTLVDSSYSTLAVPFNSTPTFADIDADADFDFFVGGLSGYMYFYRNDGDSLNANFVFADSAFDSVLAFPGGNFPTKHGTSSICLADITGDNVLDLFWGDINNTSLYYFNNGGTPTVSNLAYVSESYIPSTVFGLNHSTFADIDNDNDNDMLIGVSNGAAIDNLRLLRNTGTPSVPSFTQENLNYLDMIDVGSSARVAFGDLDGDSDLDMLLGGIDGKLRLYQNVGSPFAPSFVLADANYKGISVGFGSAPVLADWDSDNDLDLFIGTQLGRIEYWENVGSPTNFDPIQITNQLAGIKVDQLAVPQLVDMNDDDLLDLVLGEWDFSNGANVLLYENVGGPTTPSLSLVTSKLLPAAFRVFAVSSVFDWDGDGRKDIILGNRLSGLQLYRNTSLVGSFPDSTVMILQPDTIPGYDDGGHALLSFVDIDGDLDDDIFVAEDHGGFNFYRKDGGCCVGSRGNVNGTPSEDPDIADVTYLVAYAFKGGPFPPCADEANVNGVGGVDIADVTFLVAYAFKGGAAPPACP